MFEVLSAITMPLLWSEETQAPESC